MGDQKGNQILIKKQTRPLLLKDLNKRFKQIERLMAQVRSILGRIPGFTKISH
jgi:hypothetical protein